MKTINLTLYYDRISPDGIIDGGVQGDDCVTQIVATADSGLLPDVGENEQLCARVEAVNGAGEFYTSDFLTVSNSAVTFPLAREITAGGGMATLNFVYSVMKNGIQTRVKYSPQVRVKFSSAAEYYRSQYLNTMSGLLSELHKYREWLSELDMGELLSERITALETQVDLNTEGISENESGISSNAQSISTLQSGKVDKVTGKGLSTNDYTNADKALVQTIEDKADADDVYTKTETDTALDGKVDKVTGKGLSANDYTNTDKALVQTITDKADKTFTELTNEDLLSVLYSDVNTLYYAQSDNTCLHKPNGVTAFAMVAGNLHALLWDFNNAYIFNGGSGWTKITGESSGGDVDDVTVDGVSVVTDGVAEIDLSGKADADDVYTKTEVNTRLQSKAPLSDVDILFDILGDVPDDTDVQSEIDDLDTAKENLSNKVTTITSSSTNTQYPTAKAVYDLFSSLVNGNEVEY